MTKHPRIEINPQIMFGKPVIRDTRITVEHILRMAARGWTMEDFLEQHPRLTREDVLAANAFAADQVRLSFTHVPDAAE